MPSTDRFSWSSIKALTLTIGAIALQASLASAHGLLYSPNGKDLPGAGSTRGYSDIGINIDSLRAPSGGQPLCRGRAPSNMLVPVRFGPSGSTHTITLAFSIGAQHQGPCTVEIINPQTGEITLVGSVDAPGCARPPIAQLDTNKLYDANTQCGGVMPDRLRTNDMCLTYWTFTLQNVEKIKCTKCVMRWYWVGTHISPPEVYENCIDISLTTANSNRRVNPIDESEPSSTTTSTSTAAATATAAAAGAESTAATEAPSNLFAALSVRMNNIIQRNARLAHD
ncbi:hypothetical protein HDU96_006234 [Phlyctochytrium bullatum]|nr:hypothetical protein HDU96_006234 [Phlyctochytrium bullatum]